MAKNRAKKPKPTKKPPPNPKATKKKKLPPKKTKKLAKTPAAAQSNPAPPDPQIDSDSSSDGEPTAAARVHKLLDPYTKDQLIDFAVDFAVKDASLFARILAAADRDVSHRKIFVYGLGWDTTRETLVSVFEPFGELEDCNVVVDRVTGKAKGFAFVLFKSRKGAIKALKEPRKRISNRMTSCQLASLGPAPSAGGTNNPGGHDALARKIYVSNVQPDVDPERLGAFFAKFGEIELGPIGFDTQTGKSRGYALFVYKTLEGARKALEEPYKIFEGHQLHCQKASDGKSKAGPAPVAPITTAVQPVQSPVLAAMAAAQNLALFGQYPGLNPMYSAMLANPNAGLMAQAGSINPIMAAGGLSQGVLGTSQVGAGSLGSLPTGFGGYGASASHGLGGLAGNSSLLGAYGTYGSSGATGQGLQQAYQSSQIGQRQPSSTRAPGPGIGGSFGGYPSYM